MVNMSRARRTVNLTLTGFEAKDFKKYVTDKDHDLNIDDSDNSLTAIAIPARSVTTVVINSDGTGIETPNASADNSPAQRTYNLQGMEVKEPSKGIIVKKGKKRINL